MESSELEGGEGERGQKLLIMNVFSTALFEHISYVFYTINKLERYLTTQLCSSKWI